MTLYAIAHVDRARKGIAPMLKNIPEVERIESQVIHSRSWFPAYKSQKGKRPVLQLLKAALSNKLTVAYTAVCTYTYEYTKYTHISICVFMCVYLVCTYVYVQTHTQ